MLSSAREFKENIDFTKSINEDDFFKSIIIYKDQMQDLRLDEISANLKNLNFKMNNLEQNVYNYYQKPIDAEYALDVDDEMMKISEDNRIIREIIFEVKQFKQSDDIQDQIASCACISDKCLKLLKIMKRNEDENKRKSTLHLFFQSIKRNYAKGLFSSEQINLMILMLNECQNEYISESKYFEFDEKLYQLNLSVFPEEE